jgi:biopolymer transport protein ExbD
MAASTYASRLQDGAMADMNVTPLVDVMLVMLVIFMITAPALTRPLPLNLPQDSPTAPPAPPARIELRVVANGGFMLDGRMLGADSLRAALADAARESPHAVLHVSAADDSEYQGFATALEAANASGLTAIALD